jgi:hypothetical protein
MSDLESELENAERFANTLVIALQWQPDDLPPDEYAHLYGLIRFANRRVTDLRRKLDLPSEKKR